MHFLIDCLTDLRSSLRALGGDLVIRRGDPVDEVVGLARSTGADAVHLAGDVTAPADQESRPSEDSLLEAFLAGIVADEYESVAVHRDRGRGARHRWALAVVAALIGLMLAAALANTLRSDAERQQTRDALLSRITALSEGVSQSQVGLDEQKTAVATLQAELLESSAAVLESKRVERLAELAATTPLAGPGLTVTIAGAPDAAAPSPEQCLVQVQDSAQVWAALRRLPPPFREALVLVDLQGRPYAEAGRIAGVEINTLRTRLHRARLKLAPLLNAAGGSRG